MHALDPQRNGSLKARVKTNELQYTQDDVTVSGPDRLAHAHRQLARWHCRPDRRFPAGGGHELRQLLVLPPDRTEDGWRTRSVLCRSAGVAYACGATGAGFRAAQTTGG